MLIDSHCHLHDHRFQQAEGAGKHTQPAQTAAQLLANAQAAGVNQLITVATAPKHWPESLYFAAANPGVGVAAGLHPCHVDDDPTLTPEDLQTQLLAAAQAHPALVAFGETGLDYADAVTPTTVQRQQDLFRVHFIAARQVQVPVVIHTREAEADTLAIIAEFPGVPFVLHCFTGSAAMARQAVEQGGYISFSGILTFKKSTDLRNLAASLPPERILLETDAPYLAPEPQRGRRNQPALLPHTAAVLAAARSQPLAEIMAQTAQNTCRLFPRLARPA